MYYSLYHILWSISYHKVSFSRKRHALEYKPKTFHSLEVFNPYHFDSNFLLRKNWNEKNHKLNWYLPIWKKCRNIGRFQNLFQEPFTDKTICWIFLKFRVFSNTEGFGHMTHMIWIFWRRLKEDYDLLVLLYEPFTCSLRSFFVGWIQLSFSEKLLRENPRN